MDPLLESERQRLVALVKGTPRPQPDAVAGIALIDILALLEKRDDYARVPIGAGHWHGLP